MNNNNNKNSVTPELSEMVKIFAEDPRNAFTTGGPHCKALAWDNETPQTRSFTFSRFLLSVCARDYDFQITDDSAHYVDGFGDRGLDGIVIVADDRVISTRVEAVDISTNSVVSNIRVFFIQSKMSNFIRANDVIVFGNSVQEFLTIPDYLNGIKTNNAVREQWEIYNYFRLTMADNFTPDVTLVFGYGGDWMSRGFTNVRQSRKTQLNNLRAALPNARISLDIMDNEEIIRASLFSGISVKRKIKDVSFMPLPGDSAADGFLGIVPAIELINAFTNSESDNKQLDDWLFLENPRYFRGISRKGNVGATALAESLKSDLQAQILLCHNGVNIVARKAEYNSDENTISLITPQVINGCQSCYTMSEHRDKLDDVKLVVKITITEDQLLKDAIIRGSNTQEVVSDFDMLSRHPYVRELEKEFERSDPDKKLWLERRMNERMIWHDEDPKFDVNDFRILTPKQLMNGFTACVLKQPHSVHHSPANVLSKLGPVSRKSNLKVFMSEHDPTLYRAIGWLITAARRWGRENNSPWKDGPTESANGAYWAKYHFLYALWLLVDDGNGKITREDLVRGYQAQKRFESIVTKLSTPIKNNPFAKLAGHAVELADKRADELPEDEALSKKNRSSRAGFRNLVAEAVKELKG